MRQKFKFDYFIKSKRGREKATAQILYIVHFSINFSRCIRPCLHINICIETFLMHILPNPIQNDNNSWFSVLWVLRLVYVHRRFWLYFLIELKLFLNCLQNKFYWVNHRNLVCVRIANSINKNELFRKKRVPEKPIQRSLIAVLTTFLIRSLIN